MMPMSHHTNINGCIKQYEKMVFFCASHSRFGYPWNDTSKWSNPILRGWGKIMLSLFKKVGILCRKRAEPDFECNDPEWRSMTGWHWDKVHPPNPFSQSYRARLWVSWLWLVLSGTNRIYPATSCSSCGVLLSVPFLVRFHPLTDGISEP